MPIDTASILKQLDDLMVTQPESMAPLVATRALAAIERITGPDSVYTREARAAVERWPIGSMGGGPTPTLQSIVAALRADVADGHLTTIREQIHAALFSDYLEMAEHLLIKEGLKDPAAVLIGGTLEEHLRQLCAKHNVPIDEPVPNGTGMRPRKADQLNADLRKATAYELLEQKQITSWLELRNLAAHGNYTSYKDEDVRQFLQGVRFFIIQHPA